MIQDKHIRRFGGRTLHGYLFVIADLAGFLGRSPDQSSRPACDNIDYRLTQGTPPAEIKGQQRIGSKDHSSRQSCAQL